MNDLSKQLKNFSALMLVIQVASILSILILFLFFNYIIKSRLADLAQHEARRAIVMGDFRQAVSSLDGARVGEFQSIRYYDSGGQLLFVLPPYGQTTTGYLGLNLPVVTKSFTLFSDKRGQVYAGHLEIDFSIFEGMGYMFLLTVLLIVISIPIAVFFRKKLQIRYEQELKASFDKAVARTSQMLAHDVRRPFSTLRIGLFMLSKAKTLDDVKSVQEKLIPEVDKALISVNGLIEDVMEAGSSSSRIVKEPVSPESLIKDTLDEVFRIYQRAKIKITYRFEHDQMVKVDALKVRRVLSNVVSNAVQASTIGHEGEIWFKTRQRHDVIEFCIGNKGSIISDESLPRLFDAFYTDTKQGGTGLGLAIAKKIVSAHGGKIWCESSRTVECPNGKVEFFFTLPIADQPDKFKIQLPAHSSEISSKKYSALF